ncbi:hypothetical protein BTN82_26180 [Pseudomonas chlororaphis]|uniref:Uncharacterized protein n=1 Tax=Pseudomonas chlororaphis TaxID=587753 RepID=A0A1Q8EK79_9PSED|nr:hypothetical protein BTN82_26180 [Pseudomonas chlororaphis]
MIASGGAIKNCEVIRCFPRGMAVREIAKKIDRSAKAISPQKARAFRKVGAASYIEFFELKYALQMP